MKMSITSNIHKKMDKQLSKGMLKEIHNIARKTFRKSYDQNATKNSLKLRFFSHNGFVIKNILNCRPASSVVVEN